MFIVSLGLVSLVRGVQSRARGSPGAPSIPGCPQHTRVPERIPQEEEGEGGHL